MLTVLSQKKKFRRRQKNTLKQSLPLAVSRNVGEKYWFGFISSINLNFLGHNDYCCMKLFFWKIQIFYFFYFSFNKGYINLCNFQFQASSYIGKITFIV